jgi:hypothetical protein
VNLGAFPAAEAVASAGAPDLACGVEVPEIVGNVSSTEFVAATLASGEDSSEIRGDISAAILVAGAELAVAELVCSSGFAERAGSKATPKTHSEAPIILRLKTEGAGGIYGGKLSRFLYEMNQNLLS